MNLEKISPVEAKKETVELFLRFKRICDENKLRYWIAYGTLLGAVRHKGFIPWDDDFDVFMPYEDFVRFYEIVNQEDQISVLYFLNNIRYPHGTPRLSNNSFLVREPLARYSYGLGIFIDIYLLNGISDKDEKLRKRMIKRKYFSSMLALKKYIPSKKWYMNILRFPLFVISRFVLPSRFNNKTYRIAKQFTFKNGEYCSDLVWNPNHLFKKQWFEKTTKLSFEGIEVNAPSGFDELLTYIYGDYMTPPPENKRIPYHISEAYRIKK